MLDEAGWTECKIAVSNSLDEYLIQDLLLQGAQIDYLRRGRAAHHRPESEPVFGGVYKLAAVEDEDGTIVPKIKISENVGKDHQSRTSRSSTASTTTTPARPWRTDLCVYDEDDGRHRRPPDDLRPRRHLEDRRRCTTSPPRSCRCPSSKTASWSMSMPTLDEIQAYCQAAGGHPVGRGQAL